MGFFHFVHQQHRMGLLIDRFGEQATGVITDVAGRRADQARYGVTLHVLGHIETDEFDAHDARELASDLGLADTGRAGEQERADRLFNIAEARTRHLDRRRQARNSVVLTEHDHLQIALKVLQHAAIGARHRLGRDARDLGNDFLDVTDTNGLAPLGGRQ